MSSTRRMIERTGTGCTPIRTGTGISVFRNVKSTIFLFAFLLAGITNVYAKGLVTNTSLAVNRIGSDLTISLNTVSKNGDNFMVVGIGELNQGFAEITLYSNGQGFQLQRKVDQEGTGGKVDQEGTGGSVVAPPMVEWGVISILETPTGFEGVIIPTVSSKSTLNEEITFEISQPRGENTTL